MAAVKQKSRVQASVGKSVGKGAGKSQQHSSSQHSEHVAEAAYYKAEKRGFAPGYEMQDWLEAETEISKGSQP